MGRKRRAVHKAIAPGGAAMLARASATGATPRRASMLDAVNVMTSDVATPINGEGVYAAVPMPRSPLDLVPFGPNWALPSQPLDPARRDTGRPEPRLTEYPVAWNIPGNGRKLIGWGTLRAAAEGVDIIRRCITVRQKHIRGLDYAWGVSKATLQDAFQADASAGRQDTERALRDQYLPEIQRMEEFWETPWKSQGWKFGQWINGVINDHLTFDAVAIYPQATYGGDILGLEVIDASTIKPLLDHRGARPQYPFPAFQQDIYGYPRGEWQATVSSTSEDGSVIEGGFMADQLCYWVENVETWTPYGRSAVENALISAKLYLKRQGWMLGEYDDSSIPMVWLVPSGKGQGFSQTNNAIDGMTPGQRQVWEQSLNDMLSGNTAARMRAKVTPPGMVPYEMKTAEERYKSEYDLHLIKLLAGHFSVTMSELGFTESQGLGNSGLHAGQAEIEQRVGQRPDEKMLAELINHLAHEFLGCPKEVEFAWVSEDAEDTVAQDTVRGAMRARGALTLNEDRQAAGLAPVSIPEGDALMVGTGAQWVPVEGLLQRAEQAAEAEQALVDDQLATSEATRQMDAAAAEAESAAGEEDIAKGLELAALDRWRRKGRARGRAFICKSLEPADFPGEQVPDDVDFELWEWVPDDQTLLKAANDNWRTLARDHRGRWVRRGSMRLDSLGPDRPGKAVLDGLARDSAGRRAAAAPAPAAPASRAPSNLTTPFKLNPQQRAEIKRSALDTLEAPTQVRGQWHFAGTPFDSEGDAVLARLREAEGRADQYEQAQNTFRLRALREWEAENPAGGDRDGRVNDSSTTLGDMTKPGYTSEGDRMSADDAARNADIDVPASRARFGRKAPKDDVVPSRAERAAKLNEGIASAMAGGPPPAGSMAERIQARQDQAVRDVVTSLQDAPGGWVAVADVRRKLQAEHGLDRGQQDTVLRRLATTGDRALNTAPEDNQKTLTEADHAAAVDFGAGPQHLISLDPPRAAAAPSAGLSPELRAKLDAKREASAAAKREARAPKRGTAPEFAGMTFEHKNPGTGYGAPDERMETVLPDGREAGLSRTGESWGWFIRGTGALDDDGRGFSSPEAAAADMRTKAPNTEPRRSVLDTVRESSEQAAAASAVIDSVPGLREGVARQQPISHRGGTITPMPPSYEDPNGYVHVVAADGTALGRRADVATAKLALDNHAKGKPQAGARRMQQSQADRMGITATTRAADDGPVTVRTDTRARTETYNGRKLKVQKHPRKEGHMLVTVNGQPVAAPPLGRPESMDRELEQLRRNVDAADQRRAEQAPGERDGYADYWYEGAPKRATAVDDPELVTVREEGRQNNPGYAVPTTPPAARQQGRPVKLSTTQHHVLSTAKTSSAGYLIADRRTMPALERAGLAEQIDTQYGRQWVATDAGRAALERADADLRAELDARYAPKPSTPAPAERVAAAQEALAQAERRLGTISSRRHRNYAAFSQDVATAQRELRELREARAADDGPVTVREASPTPGFALPAAPPAAPKRLRAGELSTLSGAAASSREGFRAELRGRGWSDAEVDAEMVAIGVPVERPIGETMDFRTRVAWAARDRMSAERSEAMRAATPAAFRSALDGDAPKVTRPADRKVFEQMRAAGWVVTDHGHTGTTFTDPSDDTRRITAQGSPRDGSWTFFAGQRKLTGKAAIERTAPATPEPTPDAPAAPAAPITASTSGVERFSGPRGRTEMKHRLREVSKLGRNEFDALPDDVKARITADLEHIGGLDDWIESRRDPRFRGSTGVSGVPGEAREIKRRLTAPLPPRVDNSPSARVAKVREATSESAAHSATYGASKAELIDMARELGIGWSNGWKIDKFRNEIAKEHGKQAAAPKQRP